MDSQTDFWNQKKLVDEETLFQNPFALT